MPVYEYWCPVDRTVWSRVLSIREYDEDPASYCPECGVFGKREFSVQIAPVMQEHYEKGFGVVSDNKHRLEALKHQEAEAFKSTGISHSYALADPMDAKGLGVDPDVAATVKGAR